MRPAVGLSLPPEARSLDLLEPLLLEVVDYFSLCPEATWQPGSAEARPNGHWHSFRWLRELTGRPVVARSVELDLAGPDRDHRRRRRWLRALQRDAEVFGFSWLSCPAGASRLAGEVCALPIPVPWDALSIRRVRTRLRKLRQALGDVSIGIESSLGYFSSGDPLEEAGVLGRILEEPGTGLVLDLHNLWAMGLNQGFSAEDWLDRVPLERVLAIHVSGGVESPPDWLHQGPRMRLDSHDGPVSEPVWSLLEAVLPRCPALRGVTLERMEGSFAEADVPALGEELHRIRTLLEESRPQRGAA